MHLKIKNHNILILLMILCFASCDSNRIFDQYKTLPNASWHKNDTITFRFSVEDTIAKRNLFINLRNNNTYPFSNLFLITQINFPNNQKIIDTLEYDMTDKTGKFLGKGFSEIKENKLFYKENIIFPTKGNYNVTITQSMRKNGEIDGVTSLNGITDVGFRIEKTL